MPQQTNRIPFGFLDLVGAETGGKTPPFYSDELKPSVDMTELYLQHTHAGIRTSVSQSNVADFSSLLVPTDESWMLRAASFRTAVAVTNQIEVWQFSFTRLPRDDLTTGPFPVYFITRNRVGATVVGEFIQDAVLLPKPIVLGPGTNLAATLMERDAGAARTTLFQYLVSILR